MTNTSLPRRILLACAGVMVLSLPGAAWAGPDSGPDWSFVEISRAAGVEFIHATPFDAENYTSAMDTAKMRAGAAAADFDRDGDVDLFLVGGGLRSDALYSNNGDGTFTDVTSQAGIAGESHLGAAVAVGDVDGDGWLDLFVTSHGPVFDPQPGHHRLWMNLGDGTFADEARARGLLTTSVDVADGFGSVFGDYDLDGDLDLFVAGWVKDSGGNRLFRNDGTGNFEDVTEAAGIAAHDVRGFSPCLVDMSGDRYPELLLVADFGTSRYFVNGGDGTFRESTLEANVGEEWSGMGTAAADIDNDGLLDWYVTAIFDDAGDGRGDGNQLYINAGDGTFTEIGTAAGVADGGWGWGAVIADLDHDGWQDIVEVNGWHFLDFEDYTNENARLWVADGTGGFIDRAGELGLDHDLMGLSLMEFDYDGDGDQDLGITSANDEFRLYRNDLAAPDRHWLRVRLETAGHDELPPDGLGAMIRVRTGETVRSRAIAGCSNYLSTSEPVAHFGLGDSASVDELVVEWPNGTITELSDLGADRTVVVGPDGVIEEQAAGQITPVTPIPPDASSPGDVDSEGSRGWIVLLLVASAVGAGVVFGVDYFKRRKAEDDPISGG